MPFGTRLAEKLSARKMMFIGGLINVMCLLLASFVPRESFGIFVLLWITAIGTCNGLTYIVPIKLGWRAFPKNQSLMSGIIISGFGLGPLIFIQFTRLLVNPHNLSQEPIGIDSDLMQFPEEVALRVPAMIRWLALSYSVIILTAICLVNEPAPIDARQTSDDQFVRSDNKESSEKDAKAEE